MSGSVSSRQIARMTPESLLRDALHARDEWRYADVVAMVDPNALRECFSFYCEVTRPRTLESFAAQYPELAGDELARSFARWLQMTPDPEQMIAQQVADVSTHAELIVLTPESFLERHLTACDDRFDIVRRMRKRGWVVPDKLLSTPPGVRYDIIGSVRDGDDYAHVLYRVAGKDPLGVQRGEIELESVRRQADGSWRLLVGAGVQFLRTRHSSISIIDDEQMMELYTDESA